MAPPRWASTLWRSLSSLPPTASSPGGGGNKTRACSLFGVFGALVQFLLAVACGAPLVLKWRLEPCRRPFMTFAVDCSKQVVGNLVMHFANVALSTLLATTGASTSNDCGDGGCVWYFITFIVDCACGVALQYALLLILKAASKTFVLRDLMHYGFYGTPFSWRRYGAQLAAWVAIVAVTKAILGCLVVPFAPLLLAVGEWVLTPVRCKADSDVVELLVVMLAIPGVLNSIAFLVTDQFIKHETGGSGPAPASTEKLLGSADEEEVGAGGSDDSDVDEGMLSMVDEAHAARGSEVRRVRSMSGAAASTSSPIGTPARASDDSPPVSTPPSWDYESRPRARSNLPGAQVKWPSSPMFG